MNREHWLERLTDDLRPLFEEKGFPLPERVRVSVGFPSRSALAKKKTRIGECWDAASTEDGVAQIFISPILKDDLKVGGVLVHELVHAAVGNEHGHKGPFAKCARAVGLEGKLTATTEGEALTAHLKDLLDILGPYPHKQLQPTTREKKQTTRQLKVTCAPCAYIARVSRLMLDTHGAPICPACEEPMTEEGGTTDEEVKDE